MLERQQIGEMMRERKTLVLALAGGVLGLAASLTAYHYLEREETQLRDKMKEEQSRNQQGVVVAKADLPAGTAVTADNMAMRQVPKDYIYAETILPGDFDKISGQSLVKPLGKGQPLLRSYLSEGGAAGLSDKVKAGRRAIAINVDEVSSINGLIVPGDQIDLLLSSRSNGMVIPLLQGVKVLATGAQVAPKAGQSGDDKFGLRYATMTLDVAPEDAEKVILAREHGALTAVLRGRKGEEEQTALVPMRAQELFGVPALRGGLGYSVTYFVRGQSSGVADSFEVPVGMPMPQGNGGVAPKSIEPRLQVAAEQDKDRKSGEQAKQ